MATSEHSHAVTLYNFDGELWWLKLSKLKILNLRYNFVLNEEHVLSSCEKTCSTSNEFSKSRFSKVDCFKNFCP